MTHPCGCVNVLDEDQGILRSESKCERHATASNTGREDAKGREYYEKCGTVGMERKIDTPHVAELVDALGERCAPVNFSGKALEVGCGVSPYAAWLQSRGYSYFGLDTCGWAVGYMRDAGYETAKGEMWTMHPLMTMSFDLVLAAHVLEHLVDSPVDALCEMRRFLKPGGRLVVVVPDDSDQTNPDHLWFFTQASLAACMRRAHFSDVRAAERRIVTHEMFLYAIGTWDG